MEKVLNLQHDFFRQAKRKRAHLNVFLMNGKRLTGQVRGYDKFTLILSTEGADQMVFKHAISTIRVEKGFANYIDFSPLMDQKDEEKQLEAKGS